jgi:putative ABC transport system permease protein
MKWAFNDLRANKGVWSGVLLVLVVTQTTLCAMGVVMGVKNYYLAFPGQTGEVAKHLGSGLGLVYGTAVILGCLVIMSTLEASIRQRRQGLALLSLLGATPQQVLALTVAQVFVLTMASSVMGLALSPFLAPRILEFHSAVLHLSPLIAFTWQGFLFSALKGLAAGFITAVLGTCLTLRELKRMVPVELLRRTGGQDGPVRSRRVLGGFLLFGSFLALLLPFASAFILSRNNLSTMSKEQITQVLTPMSSGPLLAIVLFLIALACSGGPIIQWTTRIWTRLIPVPAAVWKIARAQAVVRSRGKAFGSTIISLTACLLLVGGLLATGQTSTASIRNIPQLKNMSSASPMELFSGFWAALLITLIGAVASFAISAKERNIDLSLVSIAGAGPRQLLTLSALDGFILMTTGVLVASTATWVAGAATAVAVFPLSGSFHVVFPWQFLLALGTPLIIIGSLATLFSARSTLRKPAIATIQAAIGE